ncbi:DNA/RNA polymerases superfamily protein [Gossypium australe]|uniref:DNA/RNA polymerases superfamily protein n=1 Tax=Gossypium australe TaxID=47621 RepID=A0A5B6V192_9ROSI|nr:DNA/RNA polymerases superfamily protein [Gossypium australe]
MTKILVLPQDFRSSCMNLLECDLSLVEFVTPIYWSELSEKGIVTSELIQEAESIVELIRDILNKSYADLKRRNIKYSVGDKVFLKVSLWKKALRFGRKGKLSPKYIGPYEIIERVGSTAYRLALPLELQKIQDVFHVFMLRQYHSKSSHVIPMEEIEIQANFPIRKNRRSDLGTGIENDILVSPPISREISRMKFLKGRIVMP